ncbi:MAG: YdaF family protein [Acidiferrobacterales bacterium]|nr:YdaF family protein [Acidiferrobacterales bacterium]
MKTIKLIEQDGNRSVGIFQEVDGSFLAMTYTASKSFKTIKSAEKFLEKRGF